MKFRAFLLVAAFWVATSMVASAQSIMFGTGNVYEIQTGTVTENQYFDIAYFSNGPATVDLDNDTTFSFTITAPEGEEFEIVDPGSYTADLYFGAGMSAFNTAATEVSSELTFSGLSGTEPTGVIDESSGGNDELGIFLYGNVPITASVDFTSLTYTVTMDEPYTANNTSVENWYMQINTNSSSPLMALQIAPEPSTFALLGLTVAGGGIYGWRNHRRSHNRRSA